MGMDAALRRRGEGGAAPRLFDHAERAARTGLSDDAARDAHAALERRRRAPLHRRAVRQHVRRPGRSEADRRTCRPPAQGRAPDPAHRLRRPQSARGASDRGTVRTCRHRGVRIQHDHQHSDHDAVLRGPFGRQAGADGRSRPPGRHRRARGSRPMCSRSQFVLGAHRHRYPQRSLSDVDVPGQHAPAGRQRPHSHAAPRRGEEQGDARVQAESRGARGRAEEAARGARGASRETRRRQGQPRTRSIRIT